MNLDKSKWKKVRLGEVVFEKKISVDAKACGLERYIAGEHMASEDLHLRTWGTIGDDYLGPAFHRKFEKGDILYGSRRTYLKKVAIADFDGITANTTFVLTENTDLVVPGFIPFLMLSDVFTEHSVRNSKGSVNPYINYKDIAQFQFLLPPKEQQARLAELLWAGDAVVESKIQLLSKSVRLYKKALDDLTIQKEEHSANLKYNEILGIHIPEQLEFIQLENLLTDICYGSSVKSNMEKKGFPMLRIPNVVDEKLNLSDLVYADLTENEFKNALLNEGDILIVRTNGNPSYVGRSAIFNLYEPYVFASYLIKISINRARYNPDFVLRFLQTSFARKYFEKNATSSAGNYNINTITIKSIPVPTLPLVTQNEVSAKLKQMEYVTIKIQDQINLDKSLTQNLLNQIFNP